MDLAQMAQSDLGNNESKSDLFKSRKYFITINNYTMEHFNNMLALCQKSEIWFWCREVGEQCKTPHFHLWIQFKNAKHRTALKKAIGKDGDYQGAKGTLEESAIYQKKGNDWDTNIRSLKYELNIDLYDWQKDICKVLEEEPDDRSIYWYWETEGNVGKTTFQKWYFMHHKHVLTLSGKAVDMKNAIINYVEKNKDFPRVIFINIPRSVDDKYVSYTGIEEIKDMYFFSGKYEGGMVCGPNPHVMVFSNREPVYYEMSIDRWKVTELGKSCYNDYEF